MKEESLLINKITKALSYHYREDKTSPNITISFLKSGYYCSLVRYGGPFSNHKEVICKSTKDTLYLALQDVANQFLNIVGGPKNPVQELSVFIREIMIPNISEEG